MLQQSELVFDFASDHVNMSQVSQFKEVIYFFMHDEKELSSPTYFFLYVFVFSWEVIQITQR